MSSFSTASLNITMKLGTFCLLLHRNMFGLVAKLVVFSFFFFFFHYTLINCNRLNASEHSMKRIATSVNAVWAKLFSQEHSRNAVSVSGAPSKARAYAQEAASQSPTTSSVLDVPLFRQINDKAYDEADKRPPSRVSHLAEALIFTRAHHWMLWAIRWGNPCAGNSRATATV